MVTVRFAPVDGLTLPPDLAGDNPMPQVPQVNNGVVSTDGQTYIVQTVGWIREPDMSWSAAVRLR
jgi:hypothetical protein